MNNEIIGVVVGIIGIIAVASYFGFMVITIFDIIEKNSRRKQFEVDLKLSIKNSQASWDEIKGIASTRGLNQRDIIRILENNMREILTHREKDLLEHKDLVESYILEYKKYEPFEGIPDEIRIHLERLQEKVEIETSLLEPLTTQIVDLLKINNSVNKRQRFLAYTGVFFGIIGFIYGIYASNKEPIIPDINSSKKYQNQLNNEK